MSAKAFAKVEMMVGMKMLRPSICRLLSGKRSHSWLEYPPFLVGNTSSKGWDDDEDAKTSILGISTCYRPYIPASSKGC